MNACVDFETANELWDNRFPHPEKFYRGMACYEIAGTFHTVNSNLLRDGLMFEVGYGEDRLGIEEVVFAPTALEIIDQMPEGTHIKKNLDGLWYVWFNLPSMQHDFRHDKCPHVAAAKAFIAWKKGLET